MNVLCFLGLHDWMRVAPIEPIAEKTDFGQSYIGHFALAECKRCGHFCLKECCGHFRWYTGEELTKAEYMAKYPPGKMTEMGQ